jgi:hypothetical protein
MFNNKTRKLKEKKKHFAGKLNINSQVRKLIDQ